MTTTICPPRVAASSLATTSALAGFATIASLFLAACGGNGDSPPPAPPPTAVAEVPVSAVATDASLEMFAINLARTDTAEPLMLDLVKAMPTSESDDPIATP